MSPIRRRKPPEPPKLLHCSFCGKHQDEVRKLIAGPTVYICDECIDLCNDIIAEEGPVGTTAGVSSLMHPRGCRVCRVPKDALELVAVPDLGDVCDGCVVRSGPRPSSPAPP